MKPHVNTQQKWLCEWIRHAISDYNFIVIVIVIVIIIVFTIVIVIAIVIAIAIAIIIAIIIIMAVVSILGCYTHIYSIYTSFIQPELNPQY